MHLALSSNGFGENTDLVIMMLEKTAYVLKASGMLVLSQRGDWIGRSGMLQGGDWDLSSRSWWGDAGRCFTPFSPEQNAVVLDGRVQ